MSHVIIITTERHMYQERYKWVLCYTERHMYQRKSTMGPMLCRKTRVSEKKYNGSHVIRGEIQWHVIEIDTRRDTCQ